MEAYAIWHNKIYPGGWDGSVFGEDRSLLATDELEQSDQF